MLFPAKTPFCLLAWIFMFWDLKRSKNYPSDSFFAPIFEKCSVERGVDDFYLHDGYLFKANKICIPESSLRKLFLQESHGGGLMGHFGREKTYAMLSTHYSWPRMYRDVERLCRRCTTCLQAKYTSNPYGLIHHCLFLMLLGRILAWISS